MSYHCNVSWWNGFEENVKRRFKTKDLVANFMQSLTILYKLVQFIILRKQFPAVQLMLFSQWLWNVSNFSNFSSLWSEIICTLTCWNIANHTCIVSSPYLVKFGTFEIGCQPVKAKPELFLQYWRGYLSRARCKWFAYGPADATATPPCLAPVKSRKVYLCGAGLPRLSWKKGR